MIESLILFVCRQLSLQFFLRKQPRVLADVIFALLRLSSNWWNPTEYEYRDLLVCGQSNNMESKKSKLLQKLTAVYLLHTRTMLYFNNFCSISSIKKDSLD